MRIVNWKNYAYKPTTDHVIYISSKGEIVPSVTTVIEIIGKKELMHWANNLGWKRISLQKELDRTADIGTIAHRYAEAILSDNYLAHNVLLEQVNSLPGNEYSEVENAMHSFDLWYAENRNRIKVKNVELEMCGDEYGGTCDLVCKLDNKLTILDFKTSSDFHPTQFMQLSAYAKLYHKIYGKYVGNVGVLRLDKKYGRMAQLKMMNEIPGGDIDYYFHAFTTALQLYEMMHVLNVDFEKMKCTTND